MPIALADFVETCKARGFTPDQARILLQDRRVFGSAQTDLYHRPSTPQDVDLPKLRRLVHKALDAIETPADLERYLGSWQSMVQACTALPPEAIKEWFTRCTIYDLMPAAADHPNIMVRFNDANHGYWPPLIDGRVDLIQGLMITTVPGPDAHWQRLEAQVAIMRDQIKATDAQIEASVDLPPPSDQDRLRPVTAEESVEALGLSSLSVGWGSRISTPHLIAALSSMNQNLQKRTGWHGPVLGLAGSTALVVGAPRHCMNTHASMATPVARTEAAKRTAITIFSGFGLEALPHEWFHTADAVLAHTKAPDFKHGLGSEHETNIYSAARRASDFIQVADRLTVGIAGRSRTFRRSAHLIASILTPATPSPNLMAWSRLSDALRAEAYPEPSASDWAPILEHLKKIYPLLASGLDLEVNHIQAGTWTAMEAKIRLLDNSSPVLGVMDEPLAARHRQNIYRACEMLDAFGASWVPPPQARERWYSLQEALDRGHHGRSILLAADRYWSSPQEIAARAFSQSMRAAGLSAENPECSERPPTVHPQSAIPRVDRVLDQFFTDLAPTWSILSAPDTLGARLKANRQAQTPVARSACKV